MKRKALKNFFKKRKAYPAFKIDDFVKHPGVRLLPETCKQFLAARALSILDLLNQDIISDIRRLHQLRKTLKSILYILPFCKKDVKPAWVFLETRRKLMKCVESKIGSVHDTDFFVSWMNKKHELIQPAEEPALKRIKREWQHDIKTMKKNLQPLLPAVKQFALDLKDQSGDLVTAKMVLV